MSVYQVLRACEKAQLWSEAVFLYKEDGQHDSAIRTMIDHCSAFKPDLFIECVQKVSSSISNMPYHNISLSLEDREDAGMFVSTCCSLIVCTNTSSHIRPLMYTYTCTQCTCMSAQVRNQEIYYRAIGFYLEQHPLELTRLLQVLTPHVDHARVVHQLRKVRAAIYMHLNLSGDDHDTGICPCRYTHQLASKAPLVSRQTFGPHVCYRHLAMFVITVYKMCEQGLACLSIGFRSNLSQAEHLPLAMEYLKSVQKENISAVNEALNELYIEVRRTEYDRRGRAFVRMCASTQAPLRLKWIDCISSYVTVLCPVPTHAG